MTEIISTEDVEKFKDLSSTLADLYGVPPIEIRLTITISGSRGIMNTYKLEMLKGKDWIELYFASDMAGILKTIGNLIEWESKKKKSVK